MKKLFSVCIVMTLFLFGGCQMDDFLFNEKAISKYELPGNDIPDSLIKQVVFNSGGNKLYGYWVASADNYTGKTILYCHGNKNNIDNYWDRVMLLHKLGVNVFVFDFRGFGMSEGQSSETGLHEDGIAAYNYIKDNFNVTPGALYLYGYSLGNVVSIFLAAEAVNPSGLIAESPFASANSLTQGSLILDIPSGWLTEGKFDNADEIKKIKTPLLLMHGSDDDFVRFRDNGQIVYNNAPEPKQLILVKGATHTDVPQVMGIDNYLSALRNFMGIGIR